MEAPKQSNKALGYRVWVSRLSEILQHRHRTIILKFERSNIENCGIWFYVTHRECNKVKLYVKYTCQGRDTYFLNTVVTSYQKKLFSYLYIRICLRHIFKYDVIIKKFHKYIN